MRFDYTLAADFRNLSLRNANQSPVLKIKWEPGINLILGPNGSGKTNLLETLSILTGWGAFTKTRNAIEWGKHNARLSAHLSGEEDISLTAEISSRTSIRINDKTASFTDLRLSLPSIIFLTGSINLIDGSPSSRRLFIDRLCSLFYPPFAKRLAEFKYISRSRTALLRQGKSPDITLIPFCKLGGWIMDMRREVVSLLMKMIPKDKFVINFMPSLSMSCEEYLLEMLKKNSKRELFALHPLDGPNYDELAIIITETGRPAYESLSRGQKRRLILYMIITAGKLIAMKLKREPVLLFDDLTAELDSEGREFAYRELEKTKWQVFITAPENPFSRKKSKSDNIIMLS